MYGRLDKSRETTQASLEIIVVEVEYNLNTVGVARMQRQADVATEAGVQGSTGHSATVFL